MKKKKKKKKIGSFCVVNNASHPDHLVGFSVGELCRVDVATVRIT